MSTRDTNINIGTADVVAVVILSVVAPAEVSTGRAVAVAEVQLAAVADAEVFAAAVAVAHTEVAAVAGGHRTRCRG